MTDKQLERGNQIKKELAEIEMLNNSGQFWLMSSESLTDKSLFVEIHKMQTSTNKRIDKLVAEKIANLKKEFAKL